MQSPKALLDTPASMHWKLAGLYPHHGLNIPLFSIRTENSSGIGEFEDLKLLIGWMKKIGFDTLQLLPINASGNDPSPYNALSSIALNPIYLSLHTLEGAQEDPELLHIIKELRKLNHTLRIDYAHVRMKKEQFLKKYIKKWDKSLKKEAEPFYAMHHSWLQPYAEFKALKNIFKGRDWRLWPMHGEDVLSSLSEDIEHHKILQFLAWRQMESVKKAADESSILIMGDLPILVSPDSADVWIRPDRFHLDLSAGVPPDFYNEEGQSWGFPLYSHSVLEKEGYLFWKERLRAASYLYHLYRVDHIVGLFRIWAIQHGRAAKNGHFEPKDPSLWQAQGEKMLNTFLHSTLMLPIGEDLGTIPEITRTTMKHLGIPGTKVVRWERDWEDTLAFTPYAQYPVCSLTTLSTHDSEPLRLWWKQHPKDAAAFCHFKHWRYEPELSVERTYEMIKDSHSTPSLFHVNLLQEYLSLFPDIYGNDPEFDRINVPGIVSEKNWSYRYPCTLEEMTSHKDLEKAMKSMVAP